MIETAVSVLACSLAVAVIILAASVFVEAKAKAEADVMDATTRQSVLARGASVDITYTKNRKGEDTTMAFWNKKTKANPDAGTAIVMVAEENGAAAEDIAATVTGRSVTMYRPLVQLDPASGVPGRGLTMQRVADYLVSSLQSELKVPMADVCDVQPRDHEGRFMLVRITNRATESAFDLAFPVDTISQPLADALSLYRDGLVDLINEQHKRNQDLGPARAKMERALNRLRKLQNDTVPHANAAEYVFLEGVMIRAQQYGAQIPVAAEGSHGFAAIRDASQHSNVLHPAGAVQVDLPPELQERLVKNADAGAGKLHVYDTTGKTVN